MAARHTRHRWLLCALLFAAATINCSGAGDGVAGTAGATGGILIAQTAGRLLQVTGSYHALFVAAACAHLAALAIIQAFAPRLAPVEGLAR